MRTDLFTSIGVAIAGVLIAFFVTNMIIPEISEFTFQSVNDAQNGDAATNHYNYASLTDPNPEVFNFDALNPTVEVYVGECAIYDAQGNCVEEKECDGYDENGECIVDEETGDEGEEGDTGSEAENQENV